MDLLKGLNKQQKEAVLHNEGPLLILAGAGSGKTRVLTHRVAYLIKEIGIDSASILAITFTNKAAREMKERLEGLLGDAASNMWVSTFHSMCVRILRYNIEKIGFNKNYVIFDMTDQLTVIKDCLRELNIDDKSFSPRWVQSAIGRAKDELIEPHEYLKMHEADFRMSKAAQIYELYQKKLIQNNALDFDDIIMYTIKLFVENPDVLNYYQNKFKYVLVDEYQDTNTAQYRLISLLVQKHANLCVVGDDDQSIYAFRGANIQNILDFEKEFKNCKVIKLEQNYRSTQTILSAANDVIKNNIGRKHKRLWTENEMGKCIQHFQGDNEYDEALFVANEIKKLKDLKNMDYKHMAILYRMNAQSRVLEDRLSREGIPYKMFGGLKFYDRKEIKDIIAYLRLIQNPSDDVALKRIINVPKRGIGSITLSRAEEIAVNRGCSIFSIVSIAEEIPELMRAATRLQSFASLISGMAVLKDERNLTQLIEEVINQSGILEEYEKEGTVEAQSRIENIKEFISAAMEIDKEGEHQGLEDFLSNISLASDMDTAEDNDAVTMMTVHSAKGLEFPAVFMVGMEEGIFPGYRAMTDESEVEEERRLCYVGMTRAKEILYITTTFCRTLFGNTTYNKESRFIGEVSTEFIEICGRNNHKNTERRSRVDNRNSSREEFKFGLCGRNTPFALNTRKKPVGDQSFQEGDRVEHKKFGIGTVSQVKKDGDDSKLEINFDKHGMKRLMAGYANLKKV